MPESAKVEILIDAVTEAAQQAVESVGEELNGLSADAKPAASAMDEVSDQMDDATTSAAAAQSTMDETSSESLELAGAMQVLKSRADEAGDEVAQAGAKAGVTQGIFSRLTASTNGLAIAFGTLSTAATVSLIPSLLTLSTVMLPLAGVVGGVAAAIGSLAAVMGGLAAAGVVTHMSELKTALKAAKKEIREIIQPLGQVFGPLLVDAVQALPTLVQRIVDSLGPLQQFADALRELGSVLMDAIPAATGAMFDLATRALPVVIDALRTLMDVGPKVADAVRRAFQALVGPLTDLGGALAGLLPTLYDLGITVGQLVIPALTRMLNFADTVAEAVMGLKQNLRRLAVAGAISAPAIFSVASSIGALLGPLGLAAAAVTAFVAAFKTNFLGIRDITADAVGSVVSRLQTFRDRLAGVLAGIRESLGGSAFAEGLAASIGVLTNLLHGQVRDAATSAQNALQSFGAAVRPVIDTVVVAVRTGMRMVRAAFNAVVDAVNAAISAITSDLGDSIAAVQNLARTFLSVFGGVIDVIQKAGRVVMFVLSNLVIPAFQRVLKVVKRNMGPLAREVIQTFRTILRVIDPIISFIVHLIDGGIETMLKVMRFFGRQAGKLWNAWGAEIMAITKFIFDGVVGIVGTALDAVFTAIITVLNLIQGDWKAAWNAMSGFFSDALAGVVDFVKKWGIVSTLTNVVGSAVDAVASFLTRDLPGYFIIGLGSAIGVVQKLMATIQNIFITVFNAISGIATSAFEAIINTVIDAINQLLATVDKVANKVENIPGVSLPDVGRLQQFQLNQSDFQAERRNVNAQQAARRNARTIAVTLGIDVQGEGPLADFVRQNAEAQVQDRASNQRRAMERLNIGAGATE